MKKLLVLSLFMLITVVSIAKDVYVWVEGYEYRLYPESQTAILKSHTSKDHFGDITIRSEFKYDGITYTVTQIDGAFMGCEYLTSVSIPYTVTVINNCSFMNCKNLKSVTIANSVTQIRTDAFSGCTSLTTVKMSNSIEKIGNNAFDNCYSLTSIDIPETTKSIGTYAFKGCSSLTTVTIPGNVQAIGGGAFSGCISMTDLTIIPDSLTFVGTSAFYNCTNLQKVNISDITAWAKINFESEASNPINYAHQLYVNGKVITELELSDTLSYIGDYAFNGWYGLTKVTLPKSIVRIGKGAFENCKNVTSVSLPPSLKTIELKAFKGDTELSSINLPNSVTKIKNNAFENCSGLTQFTIPDSVSHIEDLTFSGCTSLKEIVIPNSVTNIETYAFKNCNKLKVMRCYATSVPLWKTGDATYTALNYAVLFVPEESMRLYKSSTNCWKFFGTITALTEEQLGINKPEASCPKLFASYSNGIVTVRGLREGEIVEFYSVTGGYLGNAKVHNSVATFYPLSSDIIIAKTADKSTKVFAK